MTDKQIDEAFHHWYPRFLASGVDYNDLQRIIADMESWDDWCRAWSAVAAEHEAQAETALAAGHRQTATEAFMRATILYHFANAVFYRDPAQKKAAHLKKLACYAQAAPYLNPPAERLEIPFEDTSLPAYFRRPAGAGPHSCVILVCGSDSVKEQEGEWEDTLLARGMATLSFDGPGQGEMWYRMKMRLDYEASVVALVDYLLTRAEVDAGRIGLLGHSMGGYLGARSVAREQRIRTGVLLSPFFERGPWDNMSVFLKTGYQRLFGTADEAETRAIANQLTLVDMAHKITCPLLLIHGTQDTLTPAANSERLAAATSGPVELQILEGAKHVGNNMVYRVRPLAADWLMEQLEANGGG
jgi:2,6-dihydroxypseudooxynicotine hydrolase